MGANFVLGKDCKLYRCATALNDSANTPALATWIECGNARDLTINLETGEADITTRGNGGWKATVATLKDGSIDFEMIWRPGDTFFDAVQTAWAGSSEIALAALDGADDVDGSQGLASNFTVTNFSRSEPLEEAVKVSVTVKPSSFTEWYVVSTT